VIFELTGPAKNLSSLTLTRWSMQALGDSVDIKYLDSLSRTRFLPDPITQEVTICRPGGENEPLTVIEEETQTITPDPVEIHNDYKFTLDYQKSVPHLLGNWAMLLLLTLAFSTGTLIALRKQDVI